MVRLLLGRVSEESSMLSSTLESTSLGLIALNIILLYPDAVGKRFEAYTAVFYSGKADVHRFSKLH